jgi:L-alanine-DL-glutamate epimerase-like enolase superfamily enzyme
VHDNVHASAPLIGTDRSAYAAPSPPWIEAPGRYEAIAAVEMALVDLKGHALGQPVHSLLGGRVKDKVAFNAWIGTVPPEQAAREATDWLGRGFRSAKIKVSGATPEGIARVAAVRAAVGPRMALRVDFNASLRWRRRCRSSGASRPST